MSESNEQLYYREFGDAKNPPLVIVHGLYGDSVSMAPLAEKFADTFRVIAIDALGHGASPRPVGFTLEDQALAINALIESLGYDSVTLLGVSMGSYLAAQTAILYPARVSNLVLVVTKGHGKTSSVVAYAQRHGFDLATASMEETLVFMSGAVWAPTTSDEQRAAIMTAQGEAPVLTPDDRAAIDRSLQDFDLRPGLPSITAPTLVISGRFDGLNPPEAGEEVASLIPGATFAVYENSGHMLAYEEADRLVAEVEAAVLP